MSWYCSSLLIWAILRAYKPPSAQSLEARSNHQHAYLLDDQASKAMAYQNQRSRLPLLYRQRMQISGKSLMG